MSLTILRSDYQPLRFLMKCTSKVEIEKRCKPVKAEPETVDWLESLPKGSKVYDIGSNVGSYALVAAVNGHKVYAFEPPGPTFERLEENIALNPQLAHRLFAYPVLLGDENKTVRFSYSSDEPGSALHKMGFGPRSVPMPMQTLDSYIVEKSLPWPDAMKIDVDGNELRVLLGAEEALTHVNELQVEIDDSVPSSQQVHYFLGQRGFAQMDSTLHPWSGVRNVRYARYEDA